MYFARLSKNQTQSTKMRGKQDVPRATPTTLRPFVKSQLVNCQIVNYARIGRLLKLVKWYINVSIRQIAYILGLGFDTVLCTG